MQRKRNLDRVLVLTLIVIINATTRGLCRQRREEGTAREGGLVRPLIPRRLQGLLRGLTPLLPLPRVLLGLRILRRLRGHLTLLRPRHRRLLLLGIQRERVGIEKEESIK